MKNCEHYPVTQDKFLKSFAKHLDKLRQRKGFSFQEMANACEMDKAQVYKMCTKGTDLRATSIVKLAKGLGVAVEEIFNF